MATGKRFYWIKLKDSFMSSDEIDYLMSQPDGANYVVLYQMLCLKTINTGGCLVSQIGEMLIPYDAEKIQRECKWFSLATVRVALSVYKQIGLIFESPDGILTISNYSDIVGSETDYSAQKRLQRENRRRQIPVKGADNNEDNNVDNVHTEKEIEKDKDKEIENRERVRDNGSPTVDAGLAEIIRSFEDNLGGFPPAAREDLLGWREIFTDDLILLAIKKAALAGVRKWSYVNGILKVWKNEGVRTLGDVQSRDERRKPPAGQQPKRSAADDYDEIFGELLGGSTT
jgi:predicted phage replisome organizer